jgi:predicted porin
MKKSLLALAALTAFAGAAYAQSSVTLFGIMDVNARRVDNANAGTIKSLSTDGASSSRLGFRGVEDLGGGLRAEFWLEGAFGADTGCGGPSLGPAACAASTWQRKATVGLKGKFGEVRMGRDYTPTFLNVLAYEPWGYVGVASMANSRLGGGFSPATTTVRANNSISYFLPAAGGLFGQVMVAAGEGATGNKYIGAQLGYAAGPIRVSGAFGKTYKTGTMFDDLKNISFGGSYNLGFMTILGVYEKSDYRVSSSFKNEQKMATLGVNVPIGAGTIKASYAKFGGSANRFRDTTIGLGYQYDLSKRTTLYTHFGRIANEGTSNQGGPGAQFTASGSGPTGIAAGKTSTGLEFGVRHSF